MRKWIRRISLMVLAVAGVLAFSFAVQAATLNYEYATIEKGSTIQLKVADGSASSWTSADTSIATVSSSGKVKGKAKGTVEISCRVGYSTLKCMVTVVNKSSSSSRRYTVLILDTSGSMSGTPLSKQKEAAKEFCKKLLAAKGDDYIAIITFASSSYVRTGFTNSYKDLSAVIDGTYASGSTYFARPLTQAEQLLNGVTNATMKNVVLCSDGVPFDENSAYTVADRIKAKKNTWIYTLGFFHKLYGSSLTKAEEIMKKLASRESSSFIITDVQDITKALKGIANEIVSYKLTFNANGGKVSKSSLKKESGKTWGTLPTPTRSGYTFDGWYTAKSGGTKVTSSSVAGKSMTVYAHWTSGGTKKFSLTGTIKDAETGKGLSNATLKLRKGKNKKSGTVYASTKTSSSGKFSLKAEKGTFTLAIEKKNYITSYKTISITGEKTTQTFNVAVTKKIASTKYRIVLTWGSTPSDLDAMLTLPASSTSRALVRWNNKSSSYGGKTLAVLDVDDRTSYGPETITIDMSVLSKGKFCYYVHDYSNRNSSSSGALGLSGATVEVYRGSSKVATYNVPKRNGTLWHVFDITNGKLSKVNEINYATNVE